jgi:hypothetical protein
VFVFSDKRFFPRPMMSHRPFKAAWPHLLVACLGFLPLFHPLLTGVPACPQTSDKVCSKRGTRLQPSKMLRGILGWPCLEIVHFLKCAYAGPVFATFDHLTFCNRGCLAKSTKGAIVVALFICAPLCLPARRCACFCQAASGHRPWPRAAPAVCPCLAARSYPRWTLLNSAFLTSCGPQNRI